MKTSPNTFALFLALASASPFAHAATLLHSNDSLGEIEPCGCRNNPQGGMARKANLVKRLSDTGVLQLDAGDVLFATDNIPAILVPQSELQAAYVMKSLDLVGHQAIVPGEREFALGVKTFDKLRKGAKVKFLAANLRRKGGGRYLEPYAIFKLKAKDGKRELKVGVLGLVGETLKWPRELKAASAIAAARAAVPALRKQVDVLIALTHQGLEADEALAKAVKGIDFIVGGHSQSFLQEPRQIGKAWIVQSSFRNQYVGQLSLDPPFNPENYQLVGLDAGYDSPAEAPGPVDQLVKEFKTAVAELNSRQEAKAQAAPPEDGTSSGKKYQTFVQCSECHLRQFDFWRKTPHANALHPLMDKQQSRNLECLRCHTVGLGEKEGFSSVAQIGQYKPAESAVPEGAPAAEPPAPDYASVEEIDSFMERLRSAGSIASRIKLRTSDTEALPIKEALGRWSRLNTPVQCENCHQPGRDHPFSGVYSKKVEKSACLSCHTAERAPEWYTKAGKPDWDRIDPKLKAMTCPAGDLPPEE